MADEPLPLLDTNVIIRLLLRDHERYSPASRRFFERLEAGEERAELSHLSMAECAYVLASAAGGRRSRVEIAELLGALLEYRFLVVADRAIVRAALDIFAGGSCDFADAYLAAHARQASRPVISFDRDFDRIEGVERREP